jgi:hypothetical protein
MMRTGPNDASGVVWALGKFLKFIYSFFLILMNVLLYI